MGRRKQIIKENNQIFIKIAQNKSTLKKLLVPEISEIAVS